MPISDALTIEVSYNGLFFFPILKAGNDRSNRYDADGKNGFADKTIDEGTLACLELAEDSHINGRVLNKQFFAGFYLAVQRNNGKSARRAQERLFSNCCETS